MRLSTVLARLFMPALLFVPLSFGQNVDDYRSAGSGTWGTAVTWERYNGSAWIAATIAPDSGAAQVTIQAGHTITIAADLTVDSVKVLGNGHVVIDAGATVTVAPNNALMGIDVDTTGSVTVNGTIYCLGMVSGSDGSFVFNDGSIYDHAINAGSVPRSTWNAGSVFRLSGITGNNPDNTNQDFYHIEIDNVGQISNLNLGMSGNTINGNIYVRQTGPSNRYYLTSPTAYVDPISIMGSVYVFGGAFSTNGSSDPADIVAHVYGDVFVSGGNFGSSRGSGTSAAWFFHGDTVSFSNATLQNSTSSPVKIQKFVFAKQGTQILRLSNVSYGGSGTSPITFQVNAGTSLDIGTSHIPNNSTGSFILDSGAALITAHNGIGDEGNVECLADFGGGNSFVNVLATSGTGSVTVTATKGAHPNAYDASKSLQRYWTVTADAGITEATMTFNYFDISPASTTDEVEGTETAYKALRYAGSGNGWYTDAGSTVDDVFDFVTATGVSTISGVWTVGEATPDPSTSVGPNDQVIPNEFFVSQNFPNPFNPSTTITYGLPTADRVSAIVFDMLGREVTLLIDEQRAAGIHTLVIDASRLTSGTYIVQVSTTTERIVRRIVLLK